MLHLVRHGLSLPVRGAPAAGWDLDPAGYDDAWALRSADGVPRPRGPCRTPYTGRPPDLARWEALGMPDLIVVDA